MAYIFVFFKIVDNLKLLKFPKHKNILHIGIKNLNGILLKQNQKFFLDHGNKKF